jgi:hypothetical protein
MGWYCSSLSRAWNVMVHWFVCFAIEWLNGWLESQNKILGSLHNHDYSFDFHYLLSLWRTFPTREIIYFFSLLLRFFALLLSPSVTPEGPSIERPWRLTGLHRDMWYKIGLRKSLIWSVFSEVLNSDFFKRSRCPGIWILDVSLLTKQIARGIFEIRSWERGDDPGMWNAHGIDDWKS